MQASHQSDCRVPSPQKNQRFQYSVSKNVQDRFMEAKRYLLLVDEDPCRVQWKVSQRQLSLSEIVSRAKYKGQGEPLWLCWNVMELTESCEELESVSFCFILNFKPSLNHFWSSSAGRSLIQYSFLSSCCILPDLVDTRRHSKLHCNHSTGVIVVVIAHLIKAKTSILYIGLPIRNSCQSAVYLENWAVMAKACKAYSFFCHNTAFSVPNQKAKNYTTALSSRPIDISIACDSA